MTWSRSCVFFYEGVPSESSLWWLLPDNVVWVGFTLRDLEQEYRHPKYVLKCSREGLLDCGETLRRSALKLEEPTCEKVANSFRFPRRQSIKMNCGQVSGQNCIFPVSEVPERGHDDSSPDLKVRDDLAHVRRDAIMIAYDMEACASRFAPTSRSHQHQLNTQNHERQMEGNWPEKVPRTKRRCPNNTRHSFVTRPA